MQKRHESPEFSVIKHTQANAKFFVASSTFAPQPSPVGGGAPGGNTGEQLNEETVDSPW